MKEEYLDRVTYEHFMAMLMNTHSKDWRVIGYWTDSSEKVKAKIAKGLVRFKSKHRSNELRDLINTMEGELSNLYTKDELTDFIRRGLEQIVSLIR